MNDSNYAPIQPFRRTGDSILQLMARKETRLKLHGSNYAAIQPFRRSEDNVLQSMTY
jgi:hypothetical protein